MGWGNLSDQRDLKRGCLKSQDSLFFIRVGIGELFSNTQIMEGLKYFLDALFLIGNIQKGNSLS